MNGWNSMKNLAGNEISIFLFRFELRDKGIEFVLNESIAADMYPDLDKKIKPLIKVVGETLLRYKHSISSDVVMDGNILFTGEFEVMLSKGLGKYFGEEEKYNLFQDANKIHVILAEVMERKTKEIKEGSQKQTKIDYPINIDNESLVELGNIKALEHELSGLLDDGPRPGLKQMRPEDLPKGVTAERGYDHRGHCIVFKHKTHGNLGKIVLIGVLGGQTLIQADLNLGQEKLGEHDMEKKKKVFENVVAAVHKCFEEKN